MTDSEFPDLDADDALERTMARYLQSQSSGSYRKSARIALETFHEWASTRGVDVDDLSDSERGPQLMRRYASRLNRRCESGSIRPASARTYWNMISGWLSYAVRDGVLDRNPALPDRAAEPLPDDADSRTEQQFWTPDARSQLLGFVDERARLAIDENSEDAVDDEDEADTDDQADMNVPDATVAVRDRAFVAVFAYTGVRASEVLSATGDDRDGRNGLRWRDVDTDSWKRLEVLGKSQTREDVPIPEQARHALHQHYRLQDPTTDDWPVFPTGHAPSKYDALRDAVDDENKADAILEDAESVDAVLRDRGIAPPALTTSGGRQLMQRLCDAADVDIEGQYLQLHGARRGLGDELYREDRGLAQDMLRHKDLSTTREAYQHIEAEERGEAVSDVLDD